MTASVRGAWAKSIGLGVRAVVALPAALMVAWFLGIDVHSIDGLVIGCIGLSAPFIADACSGPADGGACGGES